MTIIVAELHRLRSSLEKAGFTCLVSGEKLMVKVGHGKAIINFGYDGWCDYGWRDVIEMTVRPDSANAFHNNLRLHDLIGKRNFCGEMLYPGMRQGENEWTFGTPTDAEYRNIDSHVIDFLNFFKED